VALVASPNERRNIRQCVEHGPDGCGVIADTDGAADGVPEVGYDAVAPTSDLVTEHAEATGGPDADRTRGHNTSGVGV
jgi:hypothetical protein